MKKTDTEKGTQARKRKRAQGGLGQWLTVATAGHVFAAVRLLFRIAFPLSPGSTDFERFYKSRPHEYDTKPPYDSYRKSVTTPADSSPPATPIYLVLIWF